MRKIEFSRQAERFLRDAPSKHAKHIIGRIQGLAMDEKTGQTSELKGYAPMRRLKSDEYRVIYEISENRIQIIVVGKRNDDEVYQMLKRFLE
jgi:mRNA interferase RelE/StbE